MTIVRKREGKNDLGADVTGMKVDTVYEGTISIFPPEKKAAPEPPPEPPRRTGQVEQVNDDTYVLRGVFDQ